MKNIARVITATAAIALAGTLHSATPALSAGQQVQLLPKVKGYNFKASPSKLRRLCVNYWKGRYWRQKPYYGCDGIKFRWRYYRVGCHEHQLNCIISHRLIRMGPDGANGGQGRGNRQGGQGNQGNQGNP